MPRDGAISNTLGPGPEYWFVWDRPHAPRDQAHALGPVPVECSANYIANRLICWTTSSKIIGKNSGLTCSNVFLLSKVFVISYNVYLYLGIYYVIIAYINFTSTLQFFWIMKLLLLGKAIAKRQVSRIVFITLDTNISNVWKPKLLFFPI